MGNNGLIVQGDGWAIILKVTVGLVAEPTYNNNERRHDSGLVLQSDNQTVTLQARSVCNRYQRNRNRN